MSEVPMTIVVCQRADCGLPTIPAAGRASCEKCQAVVSVAPSTMRMIESALQRRHRILCIECALPEMQRKGAKFQQPTVAQIEEIHQYYGDLKQEGM